MSAHLELLLRDVAAQLAETGELTIEDRLAQAIELLATNTPDPIVVLDVRCAVFSRSALFHLGCAMVPSTCGEAQQFREQARGGFVELGTSERPHHVLCVGDFILDPAHSAAWNDRGVWLRPFVATYAPPAWTANGLPFGVQVAYEVVRRTEAGAIAA